MEQFLSQVKTTKVLTHIDSSKLGQIKDEANWHDISTCKPQELFQNSSALVEQASNPRSTYVLFHSQELEPEKTFPLFVQSLPDEQRESLQGNEVFFEGVIISPRVHPALAGTNGLLVKQK